MADFKIFTIPLLQNNYSFIFHCIKSNKTACIDPAIGKEIAIFLRKHNFNLDFILNTHHHFDHIGGNEYLYKLYKPVIYAHQYDAKRIPNIKKLLSNGDKISIGKQFFDVLYIPGHTSGHIAYFNKKHKILFVGDTIFSSGCGRIFEGTYEEMFNSLEKLKNLPGDTKIYCAHEYTLDNIKFALTLEPNNKELLKKLSNSIKLRQKRLPTIPTTISNELKTNPFLRTVSRELRSSISKTTDAYNLDIFTHIRKLKDSY